MIKNNRQRVALITLFSIAITILIGLFFFVRTHPLTPLNGYTSSVDYPLYFPKGLPSGYSFKTDSVALVSSVVSLTITNGTNDIVVTQQNRTKDLDSFRLDGFTEIATSEGTMMIGKTSFALTAIIVTPKTLISITAPGGTDQTVVSVIGKSMTPVKK